MNKESIKKRLKNLKQNKNLSEAEIDSLVEERINADKLLNDFVGLLPEEKLKAIELFNKYLEEKSFEHFSEKQTLTQLVFLEIFSERLRKKIEEEAKDKNAIPLRLVESLRETNDQILKFKDQLKLSSKDENGITLFEYLRDLKQRAIKYYEDHRGVNWTTCPKCSTLFPILARTEGMKSQNATWFKGTDYYNIPLFKLYHNRKITKEEIAEVMGVSVSDIDFLYDNLFLKELNDR